MDLLKLELRTDRKDVRALVADAAGERGVELSGEAYERVLEAGRLLLVALISRVGPIYGVVVDGGRGHEAAMRARLGAKVTAIDFSTEAVKAARAHGGFEVREQDLFTLDAEDFDLAVEHCCFCAVDPARRDDYVSSVARALR